MTKIQHSEEFYTILQEFKKNNRKITSNFYVSPEEFEKLVKEKNVFCIEEEGGISLLVEYETHVFFYFFYVGAKVSIPLDEMEKPIICEIFTKNQPEKGIDEVFIKERFRQIGIYQRYVLKSENIQEVKSGNSVIRKSGAVNEVWDGIKENFNVLTDHLISQEEMEEKYVGDQFYYCNEESVIEGALIHVTRNNKSVLEYIFVYPKYRRKGVAEELLETWLATYYQSVNKFELWVNLDNKGAIELYKRYGFKEDRFTKYVYCM